MLKFLRTRWYEKFTDFLIDDHALAKNTDNDFDISGFVCLHLIYRMFDNGRIRHVCVIGMIFLFFLSHFNKPFVILIAT